MAVQSGIEIEGLEELQAFLRHEIPREADKLLRQTTRAIASETAKRMKLRVKQQFSRRTGALHKAIHVRQNRQSRNQISADVRIRTGHDEGAKKTGQGRTGYGADAFYWRFLEYGTVKMDAQPFRTPTVEAMTPHLPMLYRTHFGKKLERLKARRAKKRAKRV